LSESQLRFALFIKDAFIHLVKWNMQSSEKKEEMFVISGIFVNFAAYLQEETINE